MKKVIILPLAAITGSLSVSAQPSKWFVSVSSGYPFGGSLKSIKENMGKSGLNKTVVYTGGIDFWVGSFRKCDSKSNLSNAAVEPTNVTFSKAHSFYENTGSAVFAKTFPAALLATNSDLTKASLTF